MELSQLLTLNEAVGGFANEPIDIANFNFTDSYTATDGTTYGILLPNPISAPYHYDNHYEDQYDTTNDRVRDAWKAAGCYKETPFSFNVLNWSHSSNSYVMRKWHSEKHTTTAEEVKNITGVYAGGDAIDVMVDDYILETFYFTGRVTEEDFPDRVKLGIYIGAGVFFNYDGPNWYDLLMRFSIESFGWGINLAQSQNFTHVYLPFAGSDTADYNQPSKVTIRYLPNRSVDRNGTPCPYTHFMDGLIWGQNPMITTETMSRYNRNRYGLNIQLRNIYENITI